MWNIRSILSYLQYIASFVWHGQTRASYLGTSCVTFSPPANRMTPPALLNMADVFGSDVSSPAGVQTTGYNGVLSNTIRGQTIFSTLSDITTEENDATDDVFLPWDNPDNVISYAAYMAIAMVSNCVLYPALFLVGVPGNGVSCVVFWRQGLKDRMNLCLFCLALVDAVYLLVLTVQAASAFLAFADPELGAEYGAKSLVYCLGVGWGFKAASGCISMVIAVERCLCVARPLHVDSLMRTRTMAWLLAVIVVGTQLAQVVQPLAYTAVKVEQAGQAHWNIVTTRFYADNRVVLDFVLVVLLPFVIPVVSFVVVTMATAITVFKLRVASKWRKGSTSSSAITTTTTTIPQEDGKQPHHHHHQAALTVVLVLLSCVYIACTAPLVAVTLVRLLVPDFSPDGRYSNICIASHLLGTVFSAVNSAVNFFVYYNRSSRFRDIFHGLCGTCKRVA